MSSNREASILFPSRILPGHHRLHIFYSGGDWHVWLNTDIRDFDGLCIGLGKTYDIAVAMAVSTLETCVKMLQQPKWFQPVERQVDVEQIMEKEVLNGDLEG